MALPSDSITVPSNCIDACFAISLILLTVLLLFNKIKTCEDIGAIGRDGNSMFIMCCRFTVFSTAGPAVLFRELDILRTHADHRFNSNDHTFFQQWASTLNSIVWDIGRLVHFESYSMTTKLTDDRITVLLAMHLHSMTDIPYPISNFALVKTNKERFTCHFHQTTHLRSNFADCKCVS